MKNFPSRKKGGKKRLGGKGGEEGEIKRGVGQTL